MHFDAFKIKRKYKLETFNLIKTYSNIPECNAKKGARLKLIYMKMKGAVSPVIKSFLSALLFRAVKVWHVRLVSYWLVLAASEFRFNCD